MKKILLVIFVTGVALFPMFVKSAEEKPLEIIIDNLDKKGFSTTGQWMTDNGQGGQNWGSDAFWAYVNPKGADVAVWKPEMPKTGYYEVFIWHCGDPNDDHATNAPFAVVSDGRTDTFAINLKKDYGKWNSLGVFKFKKGDKGRVMTNSSGSGNAIADAVKFVYIGTKKK